VKTIRLADNLTLPSDVVTQTIAVIAKRRVGKSYLARRFTEQLHAAGQQVVIVDPKGDWWGIRSSADGKGPGLPIIIFGGERADVPLEPSGGEVVAKFVVEERVSALLDLSLLRKREIPRFMGPFLETLYRLKAQERYRTPLMLPIDEADVIAPQVPQPEETTMLGAIEDIVRRGGYRGIGCMLITQRTAVLNKNVLTQAQALIALRTIAPQDLKAMKAWIDVHGEPEQRDVLMTSLPSLPVGNAWVWSPGWPTEKGIFERIQTAPIATFDSGATPKPGQRRVEPKKPADVDLDAVRRQMADTIERAKADDPKELRRQLAERNKRIAELERAAKQAPVAKAAPEPKRVEVPALKAEDRKRLEAALARFSKTIEEASAELTEHRQEVAAHGVELEKLQAKLAGDLASARGVATELRNALSDKPQALIMGAKPPFGVRVIPGNGAPSTPMTMMRVDPKPRVEAGPGNAEVGTGGLRRILIALAQRGKALTNRQIGIAAGVSPSLSTYRGFMAKARANGWIVDEGELKRITPEGLAALGSFEPLPTGAALLEYWLGTLSEPRAAILRAAAEVFPGAITYEEAGQAANVDPSISTFRGHLAELRGLDLVHGAKGTLTASEELFG
jgi:hypothetical protein